MYYQVEEQDGYYRIGSPENVFCYLFVGKSIRGNILQAVI